MFTLDETKKNVRESGKKVFPVIISFSMAKKAKCWREKQKWKEG